MVMRGFEVAMGNSPFTDKIRELVGSVGWHLFLWGIGMSGDEYRRQIFEEELRYRNESR